MLNGDVFDFWFEWRHVMPRVGFRVLAALAALREAGVEVLWIAGNHDCWGGEILSRDVGVTYHVGPWRGSLGGWHALIEHGDGLRDKEDAPYRRLRAVLRNPLAIRRISLDASRLRHVDRTAHVAHEPQHAAARSRRRAQARRARAARGRPRAALYVYGHTHAPALEQVAAVRVFANPGAWMDEPTFLRITAGSRRTRAARRRRGDVVLQHAERRG